MEPLTRSLLTEHPFALAGISFTVGYLFAVGRADVIRRGGVRLIGSVGELILSAAIETFERKMGLTPEPGSEKTA
jgi:uncharacterized membrane protein